MTLRTCIVLQNTARRAVRWRGSWPTSAATFSSEPSTAKITTPTATRQAPTASSARRRSRARRAAAVKQAAAASAEGRISQPARSAPRMNSSAHRLWEMPTATLRACVGEGVGQARVDDGQRVLDELRGVVHPHQELPAVALHDGGVHLLDAGVEQPLERLAGHDLGHDLAEERAHARPRPARWPPGPGGCSTIWSATASATAGSFSVSVADVGEALGAGEGAPAPERDRGEQGEQRARDQERDAAAAQVVAPPRRRRPPGGRRDAGRPVRHPRTVPLLAKRRLRCGTRWSIGLG